MCMRDWQCIGPCENSNIGDLLEFNEIIRQKSKANIETLMEIWFGFWPILLPSMVFMVSCFLCGCQIHDVAKIHELEKAVKHLSQNLKTLQEAQLSGRARDGGRRQ